MTNKKPTQLPREIIDKIFLYLDFKTLQNTREIQSDYVKKCTEFDSASIAAFNGNIMNMKWLIYNDYKENYRYHYAFKYCMFNDDVETIKWFIEKGFKCDKYLITLTERFGNVEIINLIKNNI